MPAPRERGGRLLFRDQEELDRVALLLRGTRPVVAVIACAEALRPAVIEHLVASSGGKEVPEPEAAGDPERLLELLTRFSEEDAAVVRSIAIDGAAVDVLRTVNWHREKLRRGAQVLLWIDGIEALAALREVAPDAYAFRDVIAVVRGDPGLPALWPEEEPDEVRRARLRLAQARSTRERAAASITLAQHLRLLRGYTEAEEIAMQTLRGLSRERDSEDWIHVVRGDLLVELAFVSDGIDARAREWRFARCAIEELSGRELPQARHLMLYLTSMMPVADGIDRVSAISALEQFRRDGGPTSLHNHILNCLTDIDIGQGNLRSAAQRRQEARTIDELHSYNEALNVCRDAAVEFEIGHFTASEQQFRTSASLLVAAGSSAVFMDVELANCLHRRGELKAAQDLLDELRSTLTPDNTVHSDINYVLGRILVESGNVIGGLYQLRSTIAMTAAQARDGAHFRACSDLVEALRHAHDADVLSRADLAGAAAELEVAEDVSLAMVGPEPPWYTVLFPGLRSELLALLPDRLPEAIRLAEGALRRAEAVCPELIAKEGRILADHFLKAGLVEEALAALPSAEAAARREMHLRELARIQRLTVVALVRSGTAERSIQARLAALRETLDATGSLRIHADTLLDLALHLPPEVRCPDPLALLEEAHALFLEMPMPGKEARSLEAAGDIHTARGEHAQARRRYLAARRRAERYGLGLRLPLLTTKLGRQ